MKLTPLDIRQKEFRRAMRGYSDEDVDIFLDEVADEFERLFQENMDAQERIQRLEQQVAQYDGLKETLQKTLITAQQQADELKSNSRKEGELILRDAELRGRDILSESYADKQRVQQSLISLRQVEEDFRFKFKSLLEAHLNLLNEDESSEERRRFRGLVSGVEQNSGSAAGEHPSTDPAADPLVALADVAAPSALSAAVAEPADVAPVAESLAFAAEGAGPPAAAPAKPAPLDAGTIDDAPPSFLVRSGADEVPFAFDLDGEDDATDAGATSVGADELRSPVKRFLFGKKEKEPDDDFFGGTKDRDFEW
jgi:cell division initiation protein